MCDWWKPITDTLKMRLFSHCDAFTINQCRMQNCFLPKWSVTGAANCAMWKYQPQESQHERCVQCQRRPPTCWYWQKDTKGASIQSCKVWSNLFTWRWQSGKQLSLVKYDLTFHHPMSKQYQTIAAMECNGNLFSLDFRMICASRMKNLHHAGLQYYRTRRHPITFRCSYCTSSYQRHWQHSSQDMHQHSGTLHWLPQACSCNL